MSLHRVSLMLCLSAVFALAGCRSGNPDTDEPASAVTSSLSEQRIRPLIERLRRAERQWLQLAEGRAEQLPQVVRLLVELGPQVVPYVLPELESPHANTRYFATQVLGSVGDRALAEDMVLLLSDPDPGVVQAASEALGRLRDDDTVPLIFRAMETGHVHQVRWALIVRPVRPEDRELVPFLIGRLLDGHESSRISASLLLTRITGEEIPYDPMASHDERVLSAMRWERWWSRTRGS